MSDYPAWLNIRPLTTWPGDLRPVHKRTRSQFSAPWSSRAALMRQEIRHLTQKDWVIEVAIPEEQFRLDGRPRANAQADHPGIILSLPDSIHGPLRYVADKFDRWTDNFYGIAKGLEALRLIERYGIGEHGESYKGYAAITSGHQAPNLADALLIINNYGGRAAAIKATHPDHNPGNEAAWHQVEEALRVIEEQG